MSADQKTKPTDGFWITVALLMALVAYPLSFGPACWIAARTDIDRWVLFKVIYWPLGRAIHSDMPGAASLLRAIARFGMPATDGVILPGGPESGEGCRMMFRDTPDLLLY